MRSPRIIKDRGRPCNRSSTLTTYKDRAYLAYRDQGVIILDISDVRTPTMISQIKWSPPEEGNTHSIGIVVPKHGGRPDLIVAGDALVRPENCPFGYMHVIDVATLRESKEPWRGPRITKVSP